MATSTHYVYFALHLLLLTIILKDSTGQMTCGERDFCTCEGNLIVCQNLKPDYVLDVLSPRLLKFYTRMIIKGLQCQEYRHVKGLMKSFDIVVLKPKRCELEESSDNEESTKETSTINSLYDNYEEMNYDEDGYDVLDVFSVGEIMGLVSTGMVMLVMMVVSVWCVKTGKCHCKGGPKVGISILLHFSVA